MRAALHQHKLYSSVCNAHWCNDALLLACYTSRWKCKCMLIAENESSADLFLASTILAEWLLKGSPKKNEPAFRQIIIFFLSIIVLFYFECFVFFRNFVMIVCNFFAKKEDSVGGPFTIYPNNWVRHLSINNFEVFIFYRQIVKKFLWVFH